MNIETDASGYAPASFWFRLKATGCQQIHSSTQAGQRDNPESARLNVNDSPG